MQLVLVRRNGRIQRFKSEAAISSIVEAWLHSQPDLNNIGYPLEYEQVAPNKFWVIDPANDLVICDVLISDKE